MAESRTLASRLLERQLRFTSQCYIRPLLVFRWQCPLTTLMGSRLKSYLEKQLFLICSCYAMPQTYFGSALLQVSGRKKELDAQNDMALFLSH